MTLRPDSAALASCLGDSEVSVFLFHGVTPRTQYGVRNYTGKHLAKDSFVDIIRHLVARGHPASMDDLLAHVTGVEPCPARSFVITFDDGFWNNASVAAPVLSDFGVPATFYVTTDFIDLDAMSWVDRIEAAVASTALTEVTCPHPVEGTHRIATTDDQIRFMSLVRLGVKGDPRTDADQFADHLVELLLGGRVADTVEVLDRKLSWDNVRQLEADPLFMVGGHGRTHRILGYLDPAEMRMELVHCIKQLRIQGGARAEHFSYPEGFVGSYTTELIDTLGELSVTTGVTTESGTNGRGQDPMALRRFFVA
jgi:peptidoglycan/xylan/chitin deacetylase (PgdA/CDA1 family)